MGKGVEQTGIFQFVFAVGAQRNELCKFEREVKILERLSRTRATGEVPINLGAADAILELIHVAEPPAHQCAILTNRQLQRMVKVAGGHNFGTFFTFQNFQFHNTFVLCALLFCFKNLTKINKLLFNGKFLNKFLENIFYLSDKYLKNSILCLFAKTLCCSFCSLLHLGILIFKT